MKIDSLPANYKVPKKMTIGTNLLENFKVFLSFNGFAPILIGDGKKPHIWINVPANPEGTEWYPLVKDNFSTDPKVMVIDKGTSVKVIAPLGPIIDCEKLNDGSIEVKSLDLKQFGLDVVSTSEQLAIMNNILKDNKFTNINTVFSIENLQQES